jgi:hypothetical protein
MLSLLCWCLAALSVPLPLPLPVPLPLPLPLIAASSFYNYVMWSVQSLVARDNKHKRSSLDVHVIPITHAIYDTHMTITW